MVLENHCAFLAALHLHRFAIEGDLDVALLLIPLISLSGADVEAVAIAEGDAQGLHPREVTLHIRVVVADEVCVDVEILVRDYTEVLVLLAVEVEGVTVGPCEPRVPTRLTREHITYCCT